MAAPLVCTDWSNVTFNDRLNTHVLLCVRVPVLCPCSCGVPLVTCFVSLCVSTPPCAFTACLHSHLYLLIRVHPPLCLILYLLIRVPLSKRVPRVPQTFSSHIPLSSSLVPVCRASLPPNLSCNVHLSSTQKGLYSV